MYGKLQDLDIAILINNAGVMNNGMFSNLDLKLHKDTLDVDVTHVAMMTRMFINKLLERKQKSAIINVSSSAGYLHAMAGSAVYCGAKSYVNFLT